MGSHYNGGYVPDQPELQFVDEIEYAQDLDRFNRDGSYVVSEI